MSKFIEGDTVAWCHRLGALHAAGSILKISAVPEGVPVGTIVSLANERGTWLNVEFDNETRTLTEDELVRVADEELLAFQNRNT